MLQKTGVPEVERASETVRRKSEKPLHSGPRIAAHGQRTHQKSPLFFEK